MWGIARAYLPDPVLAKRTGDVLAGWCVLDNPDSPHNQLIVDADAHATFAETITKPSYIGIEEMLIRTWKALRAIGRCANADLAGGQVRIQLLGGRKPSYELFDIVTKGTHPEELERAVNRVVPESGLSFRSKHHARPSGYQGYYGGIILASFSGEVSKRMRKRA